MGVRVPPFAPITWGAGQALRGPRANIADVSKALGPINTKIADQVTCESNFYETHTSGIESGEKQIAPAWHYFNTRSSFEGLGG